MNRSKQNRKLAQHFGYIREKVNKKLEEIGISDCFWKLWSFLLNDYVTNENLNKSIRRQPNLKFEKDFPSKEFRCPDLKDAFMLYGDSKKINKDNEGQIKECINEIWRDEIDELKKKRITASFDLIKWVPEEMDISKNVGVALESYLIKLYNDYLLPQNFKLSNLRFWSQRGEEFSGRAIAINRNKYDDDKEKPTIILCAGGLKWYIGEINKIGFSFTDFVVNDLVSEIGPCLCVIEKSKKKIENGKGTMRIEKESNELQIFHFILPDYEPEVNVELNTEKFEKCFDGIILKKKDDIESYKYEPVTLEYEKENINVGVKCIRDHIDKIGKYCEKVLQIPQWKRIYFIPSEEYIEGSWKGFGILFLHLSSSLSPFWQKLLYTLTNIFLSKIAIEDWAKKAKIEGSKAGEEKTRADLGAVFSHMYIKRMGSIEATYKKLFMLGDVSPWIDLRLASESFPTHVTETEKEIRRTHILLNHQLKEMDIFYTLSKGSKIRGYYERDLPSKNKNLLRLLIESLLEVLLVRDEPFPETRDEINWWGGFYPELANPSFDIKEFLKLVRCVKIYGEDDISDISLRLPSGEDEESKSLCEFVRHSFEKIFFEEFYNYFSIKGSDPLGITIGSISDDDSKFLSFQKMGIGNFKGYKIVFSNAFKTDVRQEKFEFYKRLSREPGLPERPGEKFGRRGWGRWGNHLIVDELLNGIYRIFIRDFREPEYPPAPGELISVGGTHEVCVLLPQNLFAEKESE